MDRRYHAETSPNPGDRGPGTAHQDAEVRALRFDGFEFDLLRGELLQRDGAVVPLRPKAEALLRRFLSQPGRLLSREQLIAEVWPATVVTDDSLVQCVGELRTALDDTKQRFIRTVPRRGYLFETPVVPVNGAPLPAAEPTSTAAATSVAKTSNTWRLLALLALGAGVLVCAVAFYPRETPIPLSIDEVVKSRATLAVMPFVASTDDPQLRSTADAVADGISAQLATRIGMRGIGRAATEGFDGASPPLQRAARELKATHVATVRAAAADPGERVSIQVQLIVVANGEVFWARQFEGTRANPESLAARVGEHVTVAMRRRGPVDASLRAARPGHVPDATDLTLMGWGDLDTRKSVDDVRRARQRFETALRDDARSAIALTGLSASYLMERGDPANPFTRAQVVEHERVTELAIQLAPDNDTALSLWGSMQLMRGQPALALAAFEKANRLVPSQALLYVHAATARLLLGGVDEVQALADRAIALAEGDARRAGPAYLVAAEAALMRGDDERARDMARLAVAELPSNARAHATLAAVEALAGHADSAAAEMAACLKLWPTATLSSYDALRPSTHPVYLEKRARVYAGLRKAGLPER